MATLIFTCPNSKRVIDTGIETDKATFDQISSEQLAIHRCSHCAGAHQFNVRDGFLFEMKPRRKSIHSPAILCDEIDVGHFIHRFVGSKPRGDNAKEVSR